MKGCCLFLSVCLSPLVCLSVCLVDSMNGCCGNVLPKSFRCSPASGLADLVDSLWWTRHRDPGSSACFNHLLPMRVISEVLINITSWSSYEVGPSRSAFGAWSQATKTQTHRLHHHAHPHRINDAETGRNRKSAFWAPALHRLSHHSSLESRAKIPTARALLTDQRRTAEESQIPKGKSSALIIQ